MLVHLERSDSVMFTLLAECMYYGFLTWLYQFQRDKILSFKNQD